MSMSYNPYVWGWNSWTGCITERDRGGWEQMSTNKRCDVPKLRVASTIASYMIASCGGTSFPAHGLHSHNDPPRRPYIHHIEVAAEVADALCPIARAEPGHHPRVLVGAGLLQPRPASARARQRVLQEIRRDRKKMYAPQNQGRADDATGTGEVYGERGGEHFARGSCRRGGRECGESAGEGFCGSGGFAHSGLALGGHTDCE